MPKSPTGRLVFALIVVVLLFVIGHNLYRQHQKKALIEAVSQGDDETAASLLKQGASSQDHQQVERLLNQAIDQNEPKTARLLLEQGVNPNTSPDGYLPKLVVSVSERRLDLVRLMLEHGADPNVKDNQDGYTPLVMAAGNGDIPMMSLLLAHGAHINAEPLESGPLVGAIDNKQPKALQFLLERRPSQEARDNALIYAVRRGQADTIRLLLKYGAHPSQQSPPWLVVLAHAHSHGKSDLLALLRPLGITQTPLAGEKEARNKDRQTPLLVALSKNQSKEARYWLAQGANVNASARGRRTPLLEAIENCPELIDALLAKGADPNVISLMGDTPLKKAVGANNTPLVRKLLKHGADANLHPSGFQSILHFAIKHKQADIVALLQQAGGRDE